MRKTYDLILRGGHLTDPANDRDGLFDIAVAHGKIAAVAPELPGAQAHEVIEVRGKRILPGLIDTHVHVSPWIGGGCGHKMLALAGVTTALDMAGPATGVIDLAAAHGVGLNIACINYVRPKDTVSTEDPDTAEIEAYLDKSLKEGAIGLKILGGHYPLTPEASARTIAAANARGAYVAFHAGSLASGSNLEGVREAFQLIGGGACHLAHVASYCRGQVLDSPAEGEEALALLQAHPNVYSESYLATINGTSGEVIDGVPGSRMTRKCLEIGGFSPDEAGLEAAILAGWCQVNAEEGGLIGLSTGPDAVAYWRNRKTDVTVSFRVNPPEPRLRIATAKRPDGSFTVDSISTDGGGIPRNVILEFGLALVKLETLTMREFAVKTSLNPAKALGLKNKGHLSVGADADITVVDAAAMKAAMTIVGGQLVMFNGLVLGRGCTIITTPAGAAAVRDKGLAALVVDPAATPFLQMRP